MTLIYLSLAWVAGIYLGFYLLESEVALPLVVILPIIGAIFLFTLLLRKKKAILLLGLCLVAFLGGTIRFQATASPVTDRDLQFYNDKYVEIRGVVGSDPDPRDQTTLLRFSVRELKVDGEWQEVSGTALIYAPKYPNLGQDRDFPYYCYGDLLEVNGQLEEPPVLEDFDYTEYLARQGIYSIMYYPKVELVASGQGSKLLEWVYQLRNGMSQSLDSSLHEPECSLGQAILLGKRSTIPDELTDALAETGTMHLIAISGLHISIMAGLLLSLGVWVFGRKRLTYLLLPFLTIWGYTLISGMHPSALRAAIMGSLFLLADWVGRQRSAFAALAFAAVVMVGVQPQLLWDVSFQLSFLAMAGLILLAPHFQSLGRRAFKGIIGEEKTGWAASTGNFVNNSVSITLGAVIATLPIIAFYFHRISLVALPATFFALPALPGVIVTAALVGLSGLFSPILAQVIGWVAWLFLTYMIKVVEFFSAMPLSSVRIEEVTASQVLGCYGVIAVILLAGNNWKRLSKVVRHST